LTEMLPYNERESLRAMIKFFCTDITQVPKLNDIFRLQMRNATNIVVFPIGIIKF